MMVLSLVNGAPMKWIPLTHPEDLAAVNAASQERRVLIFKHSTRCGLSALALDRLEREWKSKDDSGFTVYFIDLWKDRDVSNAVEALYGIRHESPQALVIDAGACAYTDSHSGIRYTKLMTELKRAE
jgi:bacillithiol system protein YtxJ